MFAPCRRSGQCQRRLRHPCLAYWASGSWGSSSVARSQRCSISVELSKQTQQRAYIHPGSRQVHTRRGGSTTCRMRWSVNRTTESWGHWGVWIQSDEMTTVVPPVLALDWGDADPNMESGVFAPLSGETLHPADYPSVTHCLRLLDPLEFDHLVDQAEQQEAVTAAQVEDVHDATDVAETPSAAGHGEATVSLAEQRPGDPDLAVAV